MKRHDPGFARPHEDLELFREAVQFTAGQTGFSPRLIEKDYFCSLLLAYLSAAENELVFKGGTCLAKVHSDFFRLSEDLDFVIPVSTGTPRAVRGKKMTSLKRAVMDLPARLPIFNRIEPLAGANGSTQYNAVACYAGPVSGREEPVKIEIGLREPLLLPVFQGRARTLILNPASGERLLPPLPLPCLSLLEAYAEKFRAALSRKEAAIRDFFDLDHAVQTRGIRADDPELIHLVRIKLAVPGNEPVDISKQRQALLRRQLDAELKPVLSADALATFDLDRAFHLVTLMAGHVR